MTAKADNRFDFTRIPSNRFDVGRMFARNVRYMSAYNSASNLA